ncbi:MAG: alpha/beta hydrolase [Gordonia sp. (in: high G+C Gram-positive bacteria)]
MHFLSTQSSRGIVERDFLVDGVPGVLWSPESPADRSAVLFLGHTGGMHKRAPGLVAAAARAVARGLTVVSLDAPGHGDRLADEQVRQASAALRTALEAGAPIGPAVIAHDAAVAARAVPEWRALLDAILALPEFDGASVGFGGVGLGGVTGVLLAAAEPRITALNVADVFVGDEVLDAACRVSVPVLQQTPWDDEHLDRSTVLALFDAFASRQKTLVAHSAGRRIPRPVSDGDSSTEFFRRHFTGAESAA